MGTQDTDGPERRCAAVSRASGEPVGGTAPHHQRILVVELALPWAGKVLGTPHFPAALRRAETDSLARGSRHRLQVVAPDPDYSAAGYCRVIDCGVGAAAWRREYRVTEGAVGDLVAALLGPAEDLAAWSRHLVPDGATRDLLLCTHAEHDACCGELGRPCYDALRSAAGDDVRVWRSSHLGGHRFAPTLLDLPSGRYWGRLEPRHTAALLGRAPVAELADAYRGWCALATPAEQVAEGELQQRYGAAWWPADKQWAVVADDGAGAVTVRFAAGPPVSAVHEVTVARAETYWTLHSSGTGALVESPSYRVTRCERLD